MKLLKVSGGNHSWGKTFRMAVIAMITGVIMYYTVTQILLSDLENSLIRFAEQGATTIETYLSGRLSEARSIAANSIIKNTELPLEQRLDELKKQLNLNRFRRLSIVDTQGNSVTTEGAELYVGDRQYFIDAMQGKPAISDPIESRVDGTMVIVFSVPFLNGDNVEGVLYATYDADVLSLMTDNIKLTDYGSTYIINGKGDVIAHKDRTLVYNKVNDLERAQKDPGAEGIAHLEEKMIAGEKGAGEYVYYGEKKYMGYSPIGSTGWSIAVTAPKNKLLSKLTIVFILMSIFIITVSGAITAVLSHSKFLERDLIQQQVNTLRISDFMNLIALTIKRDGGILSTNRHADDLLLYFKKFDEGRVNNIYELLSDEDGNKLKNFIDNSQVQSSSTSLELAFNYNGSKMIYIYCNAVSEKENNEVIEILGVDITDRVEQEKKLQNSFKELTMVYGELAATEETIRRQAYFDSLTGLPNRASLYNEAKTVLTTDNVHKHAVVYMDMDNFKYVNDSFGHSTGDLLLQEAGRRLKAVFSEDDLVTRFEGDEFVIFLKNIQTNDEVCDRVSAAMDIFCKPFTIMNKEFHVSASCGIAICPDHAITIDELLKCSDVAMYRAKGEGRNKSVMFEPEMNNDFADRINLETGLRKAINDEKFLLYYQPQVELSSRSISGFEALIRWSTDENVMIPPLKFIHIAEETALIVPIGRWVLQTACKFIKDLNDTMHKRYTISVNISVVQLMQADFVDTVLNTLEYTGLEPSLLELELTESKMLEIVESNMKKLFELRERGVQISIDDFGKGFSSLSYLKQLPIDTLKIDKSFVDDIPDNDNCMIESIIHIGHRRNLIVVAEGVEKQEQLEFLTHYKCDKAQGYYYSRPLPENEVRKLVRQHIVE